MAMVMVMAMVFVFEIVPGANLAMSWALWTLFFQQSCSSFVANKSNKAKSKTHTKHKNKGRTKRKEEMWKKRKNSSGIGKVYLVWKVSQLVNVLQLWILYRKPVGCCLQGLSYRSEKAAVLLQWGCHLENNDCLLELWARWLFVQEMKRICWYKKAWLIDSIRLPFY